MINFLHRETGSPEETLPVSSFFPAAGGGGDSSGLLPGGPGVSGGNP